MVFRLCNHKKNKGKILCNDCSKNPFIIEQLRDAYAKQGNVTAFKNTYSNLLPQIRDINTGLFWDKRWKSTDTLKFQDGMTKDRINAAAGYLNEKNVKILDVGAGFGFLEELLQKRNNISLYANDFSKESIRILKKKYIGNFRLESVYDLKYPRNFFDVVFILEVLEHIPVKNVLEVLKNINKLLKKNGLLIVSIPLNEDLDKMDSNPNGHVRAYTPEVIKKEIEISGFRIDSYKFFYAFKKHYFIKKTLAKVFRKWHPNNMLIKAIKT